MSDQTADEQLRKLLEQRPDRARAGWKVAINVPAVQTRLGITRSLAAPLFELQVVESGATLSPPAQAALHVEAEIALRLKSDIMVAKNLDELRASIESYAPCLELVDYHDKPRDGLVDLYPHSFFHAGLVLGEWQSAESFEPLPVDFPSAVDSAGKTYPRRTDTVPFDVVEALAILADRVFAAGATLRAGEIVICGSYIEPVPLTSGSSVTVRYGLGNAPLSIARA